MSSKVIWMTGLSGAGKTTLAHALYKEMLKKNIPVEILDGDAIREIFPATGFTKEARDQHVRRVGFIASLLEKHGVTVICALISPYQDSRDFVRSLCKNFIELYISTPLSVCECRDPKGLYKKARRGEIKQFTGLNDPYEAPENADIVLDTSGKSIEDCIQSILLKL